MKLSQRKTIKMTDVLNALTAFFFFYGFFEPYLNKLIGPLMRYYIIFLAGLYLLRYGGRLRLQRSVRYICMWLIYGCVTLLWARNYSIFRSHFLSISGSVVLLLCLTQDNIDKKFISAMTWTFWLGSFLIGALSLFFHSTYHFQNQFSARQVLTILGVQTDPNNQAIFLMFGISISFYYLLIKKEKILLCITTVLINVISMMMTSSRGGFLSLGVMLVFIILFIIKDVKTKAWAFFAIVISVLLVSRFVPSFLNTLTLKRLLEFGSYEGGGNRLSIWKNAFALMNENPFYYVFGAGWGSYMGYNRWAGMHNTYLEMFCNTGAIGVFLFFYPMIHCGLYFLKNEKYLPVFIAISIFMPAFFIDCINKRFFWNAIYFLFVSYYYERARLSEKAPEVTQGDSP